MSTIIWGLSIRKLTISVYFYNAYSIMRDAIHKGTTKIKKF